MSDEEKVILDEKVNKLEQAFIQKFIKTRKSLHLTQQNMADDSDVIRPTVTRIETMVTSPQVRTLLKLLAPHGYTIDIVKIKKGEDK